MFEQTQSMVVGLSIRTSSAAAGRRAHDPMCGRMRLRSVRPLAWRNPKDVSGVGAAKAAGDWIALVYGRRLQRLGQLGWFSGSDSRWISTETVVAMFSHFHLSAQTLR